MPHQRDNPAPPRRRFTARGPTPAVAKTGILWYLNGIIEPLSPRPACFDPCEV
jgi:hypothetical protein